VNAQRTRHVSPGGLMAALATVTAALIVMGSSAGSALPAPTAACQPQGSITYGIAGAGITALDPNTISFAGQEPLRTLLFDALTKYTPQGTVVPDLATKWTVSKNLKTWQFTLRQGVQYADGRPFTSADVVANVKRVLDPKVASQARGEVAMVKSVTPMGKYGVKFQLSSPNAILDVALTDVKMSDTSNLKTIQANGNGTGPYTVSNFVPDQTLTLVPNTHYFGSPACIGQITFQRESDTTAMVTDFTGGKLDMIWQVPPTALPAVQHDQSAQILQPASVSGAHVWELDTKSAPFDNVLARQALSYAIDRATMVKAAFFGNATPSFADDVISSQSPDYDKSLPPYTFDLAKAKQLFTQAGVKPGTTFTFWALAGRRDEWITMAEILQQDLKKIGLNLDIKRSDVSTWLAKFYPAGKTYPGVIVGNYFSMPPNPSYAFSQVQYGTCECNWNDAKFESLAKQAIATGSASKQRSIYDQMQKILAQQAPVMVIAHQTNIVAASKKVSGAWEDPAGNVHLETASVTA
jgi:peptide/nickel transport system substrate-binding protein